MKFLKDFLDSQEKLFEKGGKLEKLYPLYEAGASFLFSTKENAKKQVRLLTALEVNKSFARKVKARRLTARRKRSK